MKELRTYLVPGRRYAVQRRPMLAMAVESTGAPSGQLTVELTEDDIPGAALHEPLDSHTVPALKWWLVCRGSQWAVFSVPSEVPVAAHSSLQSLYGLVFNLTITSNASAEVSPSHGLMNPRAKSQGALRALTRGFIHRSS